MPRMFQRKEIICKRPLLQNRGLHHLPHVYAMSEVKIPFDVVTAMAERDIVPGLDDGSVHVLVELPVTGMQKVVGHVEMITIWCLPGDGEEVESAAALLR